MKINIQNKKCLTLKLSFLLYALFAGQAFSQSRWSFEVQTALVYNARLPLTIKQTGYPDININKAIYYTEPLNDPYYLDFRFAKWFNNKSIELEGIHHKLYLINKPIEVQRFSISDGFNIITMNYGRVLFKKIIGRLGVGTVLIHPESTVRGMEYYEKPGLKGYQWRGLSINLAVARQFRFGKYFFLNTEGKITAGTSNAPIVNGSARVNNITFHFVFGPGVNWALKKEKQTE